MTTLADERRQIRRLIDENDPADAFTAYYGLHHDPKRTQLFTHSDPSGQVDGFLVRAQTGMALFQPVVALRAASESVASDLLTRGLIPARPYYLVAPLEFGPLVNRRLVASDAEVLCTYALDPLQFQPAMNVLVLANPTPDGLPRYEIRQGGVVMTAAGVNWRSPRFAEVYVYTKAEARGRGWGKSVVAAVCADLLKQNLLPVYVVHEQNTTSIHLALGLGFKDTGAREFAAQVTLAP